MPTVCCYAATRWLNCRSRSAISFFRGVFVRRVTDHADSSSPWQETLTLPFERRTKSRQRAVLDGGDEILLDLPRGRALK
ncbi:MAG: urease accessory protein UreE, partial [Acidiferrobacter sp.]